MMSLDIQDIRCDDELHGRFTIRSFYYLDRLKRDYRINHDDVILILDIGAYIKVDSPRLLNIHDGYHAMSEDSQERIDEYIRRKYKYDRY